MIRQPCGRRPVVMPRFCHDSREMICSYHPWQPSIAPWEAGTTSVMVPALLPIKGSSLTLWSTLLHPCSMLEPQAKLGTPLMSRDLDAVGEIHADTACRDTAHMDESKIRRGEATAERATESIEDVADPKAIEQAADHAQVRPTPVGLGHLVDRDAAANRVDQDDERHGQKGEDGFQLPLWRDRRVISTGQGKQRLGRD